MNYRLHTAVELLKAGQSVTVDDLSLGTDAKGGIVITGWSNYINLENLTKPKALEELEEIKALFSDMVEASSDLKTFTSNKTIEFVLCFDDAGKVSIPVCHEKNGIIRWV